MSFDQDKQYDSEDTLQWCLDPSSRTPEAERALESDPELRESFEGFENSVASLRSALSREAAETNDEGLVDQILRATTREDLTWRGDLRLVGEYLGRRVKSSWVVKLVAASLVAHLTALPILGFMLLTKTPENGFNVRLQEPLELPFEEVQPEPDRELDEDALVSPEELELLLEDQRR